MEAMGFDIFHEQCSDNAQKKGHYSPFMLRLVTKYPQPPLLIHLKDSHGFDGETCQMFHLGLLIHDRL